ncbi:MAG: MBL fold metallo-hydrolase [Bacteroidota bacterium]|nr:MBL fold metallo-hydrolase [Bacteroidota bacterium]
MNNQLEITLLGTGTSQGIPVIGCQCKTCKSTDPKDKRLRTAAFIQTADVGLAVDLGPDFRQQMLSNEISNVHAVLLTHEHNDHISGLDDIRPINFAYDREIPIYGSARSLLEIRRRFFYAFDHEYHYPGKPRVSGVPINDQPFTVGRTEIIPISVDHGDLQVYGFRIGNFAYVTDAKTIPSYSMDLLQGLDVLILNALRFISHPTHLNIEEAIALVERLRPGKTFFTHISHDMGLHAEVNAILPEHIRLGYDGLRLKVN